jgi:hypothetical protein
MRPRSVVRARLPWLIMGLAMGSALDIVLCVVRT